MVGYPLFFLIWAVILFLCFTPLAAAALLLLFCYSYSFFYDWLKLLRR